MALLSSLGWLIMNLAQSMGASVLVAVFVSATTIGLSSELMARRFLAPAALLIITGIFVGARRQCLPSDAPFHPNGLRRRHCSSDYFLLLVTAIGDGANPGECHRLLKTPLRR